MSRFPFRLIVTPIPLRSDVTAELHLPPDLTQAEADKLCKAIHALAFDQEASLGERLGFQPINSRTHGYNGQEHR